MKKTYLEAIEYVLDAELDARPDLICFRPGARRALEEDGRDVPLPRMGAKSFSVALGAALQGMHPVLDLMQESGAAELLKEAFLELPAGASPAITILACAQEELCELPGAYVLRPETPRQAAGFMRAALRMNRLTLLLADQALFAEADEIPEDRGFTLLPLEEEAEEAEEETAAPEEDEEAAALAEEEAYEETETPAEAEGEEEAAVISGEEAPAGEEDCGEPEAEESAAAAAEEEAACMAPEAPEEQPAAEEEAPQAKKEYAFLASRQTACDLSALRALCALLEMDEEILARRCAGHVLPVCGGFELHAEVDAPAGEAAFIPPEEESASLWLGTDMLTVSYDPAQMAHAEAAKLLRAVKRVLEKPQLLIYDKEYDEE